MRDVAARLSVRDRQLLEDMVRLRVLTGDQLTRLHYGESGSARRLARGDLARLVDWRVLARLERRIGGVRAGSAGYVYGLDLVGQRLGQAGRDRYRPARTPEAAFLLHALGVSELYTRLRLVSGQHGFALTGFEAEPACWRSFSATGGRLVLKPDACLQSVRSDYEERYFIEFDRNTESLARITDKARMYARYWQSGQEQLDSGLFPQVLWMAPNEQRRRGLVEALSRLDAEYWQLFATTTAEAAVHLITQGPGPAEDER